MQTSLKNDKIDIMILSEDELREQLKDERIKDKKNFHYPPILDYNPVKAADFLTIEDSKEVLKLMSNTYSNFKEEGQKNIVLEKSILLNFEWFASFTLELCNLLEQEPILIPYDKVKIPRWDKSIKDPIFFPPLKIRRGVITPEYYNIESKDPIDHYRISYIKEAYEATDFRDGFPVWYMFSNTTIYERYSAKTNVRVRIDYNNGELSYFLAGASDNWKRIVGVPVEMDDVIASLLFRD